MAMHFLLRAQLLRDRVRSFEDNCFSLPAFRALDRIFFHPAVTFLIGENGTGKSTLLEVIAVAWDLNPKKVAAISTSGPEHLIRHCTRCVGCERLFAAHAIATCALRISSMWRRRSSSSIAIRAVGLAS
jgi:recombinational DNA repair ATPase RecF